MCSLGFWKLLPGMPSRSLGCSVGFLPNKIKTGRHALASCYSFLYWTGGMHLAKGFQRGAQM